MITATVIPLRQRKRAGIFPGMFAFASYVLITQIFFEISRCPKLPQNDGGNDGIDPKPRNCEFFAQFCPPTSQFPLMRLSVASLTTNAITGFPDFIVS